MLSCIVLESLQKGDSFNVTSNVHHFRTHKLSFNKIHPKSCRIKSNINNKLISTENINEAGTWTIYVAHGVK